MLNQSGGASGWAGVRGGGRAGKVHPIILWLLGVPIPIILLILLIRGCMGG